MHFWSPTISYVRGFADVNLCALNNALVSQHSGHYNLKMSELIALAFATLLLFSPQKSIGVHILWPQLCLAILFQELQNILLHVEALLHWLQIK